MERLKLLALFGLTFTAISVARADWINVKTWSTNASLNATGDGVTDDAPRVQAAINSVSNGATLYFPSGTYKLGGTNNGSTFWVHHALNLLNKKITMVGDGASSVLLQTNPSTTLVYGYFTNKGDAGFTVKDIKFQGDTNNYLAYGGGVDASGHLLAVAGIGDVWTGYDNTGVRIQNVTFEDHGKRAAITLHGLGEVLISGCSFIHFRNTNANSGEGFPSILVGPSGVGSLEIVNNYHDGDATGSLPDLRGADGLLYQQGGLKAIMSGNTIKNYRLEGLQSTARQQVIKGNVFFSRKVGTVAITPTPNTSWTGTNIQVTVSDNTVDGNTGFIATGGMDPNTSAIKMDLSVNNNTVRLGHKELGIGGGSGIAAVRLNRVTIHGNVFDNFTHAAVNISGTGTDDSNLSIQGNIFTSLKTGAGSDCTLILNYVWSTLTYNTYFRSISIHNNFLSGGANGNIFVYRANIPTTGVTANLPGKLLVGHNAYVGTNNVTATKWFRVDNTNVVAGSTNLGGYNVVDFGP